jgi:hypothetical protein
MTTWELATAAEIQAIRLLIQKVRQSGQTPPRSEDELEGLTKKEAGALITELREMLDDPV